MQLGVLENSVVYCGVGYSIVILLSAKCGNNKYIPDCQMNCPPESGGIINFSDKIKISTSFEAIYANQRKNMNYNRKYKLYTGYKISHNNEVYAEINKYKHNNNETEISIGVVYRF